MTFYTYTYYDEKMLPYYVGKGSGQRAYSKNHTVSVPPRARILIQHWESEAKAHEMERWWIAFWGCKWNKTGRLENVDEGGRSPSKRVCREAGRKNVESGHIFKIATIEGMSKAGRMAVESGRVFTMATPESRRNGGLASGRKNAQAGYLPSISALGNHVRHHVNRGIVNVECSLCQ